MAVRAMSVSPYWELTFDADGDVDGPERDRLLTEVSRRGVRDLLLFAHGWNDDRSGATLLYDRFFAPVPSLAPVARLGYAGVIWPSMMFADEPIPDFPSSPAAVAPASPRLDDGSRQALLRVFPDRATVLDRIARLLERQPDDGASLEEFGRLVRELVEVPARGPQARCAEDTRVPGAAGPGPEMLRGETARVCRDFAGALGQVAGGGAEEFSLTPKGLWDGARELLRQATYYAMKRRAGAVGERGLGPVLGRLAQTAPGVRVHLVGHSFGARLVSFALRGLPDGVRTVKSVTLLQGAFSHYAFAARLPQDPGAGGVLAGRQRRVDGPLVCCRSRFDSVDRQVQRASAPGTEQGRRLVERVLSARRPVLVLGGDIDSAGLFDDAVRLAERLGGPVWAAPSLFRLPFPNRHPLFRGVLPAGIAPVCDAFEGHDLVLVLGAPVFRYHEHLPGRYLPEGTRLIQVTEDASAAARAPMGEALVADPGAVVDLLVKALDAPTAPVGAYRPTGEPLTVEGPCLHPEEVFAALRDELPADTTYVVESTSTNSSWWRQMDLRRPGSYYFPAAGGLGFGLPGAVGVAMAQPDRPVVGVIGDGSANYGITALWTAARQHVPLTVVLLRNGTYGALRWFGGLLGVPDAPGMDIPGIDFTRIAEGYGVRAHHATGAGELRALLAERPDGPRLIQVDTALTTPS
ncbi:thiamine pyrophosphate-dependent enzyme [Streptomyces nodosus]